MRLKTVYAHYLFLRQSAEKAHALPPSTAPCHPAPGRRLLIIRNDNQAVAANFMGFDGVVPVNTSGAKATPTSPSKHQATSPAVVSSESAALKSTVDGSPPSQRKRWSILGKSFSPFDSQTPTPTPSPLTSTSAPNPKNLDDARRETALARMTHPAAQTARSYASTTSSTETPAPHYRLYCFKFSLEWTQNFERNARRTTGERRIVSPRLPSTAQACIGARIPGAGNEVLPKDPGVGVALVLAKYSGRALAEWALIVGECNNFVERRRKEGVPHLRMIEVPVLSVEGFRRFGG